MIERFKINFKKHAEGYIKIIIAITLFIVILITVISLISNNRKDICNGIINEIDSVSREYFNENDLYPKLIGTQKTINIEDLPKTFLFKEKKKITGSVTVTNYEGRDIKTYQLSNAGFCTTKFLRKSNKYKESNNVKVNISFNYQTIEHYKSNWSNYIPSSELSDKETLGVKLPKEKKNLPKIPEKAIITSYEKDEKTYYSYRDKQWMFYKNNINYSGYSSEQPNGYTNKDTQTKKATELSEWSLDYPEVKDYRHISSATGYQWVNKDGQYYQNGAYLPDSPGEEYTKDKDNKATMYRYYDDTYKWYNGSVKRGYSSYTSTASKSYPYIDNDTMRYTSYSKYKDTSELNEANKSYREEITDTYTRFLINYDIYSYKVFDKPVSLKSLETKLNKTYEEIVNDDKIKVEVIYEFEYSK